MGRAIRTHFIAMSPPNWSAVVDHGSHLIGWIEHQEGCFRVGDLIILQQKLSTERATPRQCARVIAGVNRDVSKPHVLLQLRELEEGEARAMKMRMRRHALLEAVAKVIADVARGHGIEADLAEQLGAAAADELAQEWGGQVISIPTDYFFRVAKRDMRILAELNAGAPFHAVAKRYGMTEVAVRKLRQRKELRSAHLRQKDFFQEASQ